MSVQDALDDMFGWCDQPPNASKEPDEVPCLLVTYIDGAGGSPADPPPKTVKYIGMLFHDPDSGKLVGLARATYLQNKVFPDKPWMRIVIPPDGSKCTFLTAKEVHGWPAAPVTTKHRTPTWGVVWDPPEKHADSGELVVGEPWWIIYTKTTASAASIWPSSLSAAPGGAPPAG